MQKLLSSLAALGFGWLLALGCSEDSGRIFFGDPDAGGLSGLGGLGGSAGAGSAGRGGGAGQGGATHGGSAGDAGSAPDAGGDAGCSSDQECDDDNACTLDRCAGGVCVADGLSAAGTACGSALSDECTAPDTCDAQGDCQRNDAAGGTPCGSNAGDECSNPDTCNGSGQCSSNHAPEGTPCGNGVDDECSNPDVCANGLCLASDEVNGTACTGGSCALSVCVPGQPLGCPAEVAGAAPFTTTWSSVGRPDLYVGGCDSAGTPDYALVFTAPATATFRFAAAAVVDDTPYTGADQTAPFTEPPDGDAVLTLAEGSCAGGAATQVACNDDALESTRDAQLELPLTSGQVVTVYLNELTQSGGGTGTLTITQLP